MIIWSMSMRKYAHIFNLIIIILFVSVVFPQNYLVKTSDGFEAGFDSIPEITPFLESLLVSEHTWGDHYKLSHFNKRNSTEPIYNHFHENLRIDSILIFPQENIRNNVLVNFFFSLKKAQSMKEIHSSLNMITQDYHFIEPETDVLIGRYSEKKLLAYVSPKLNFKNNFSGFLGVANEGETRSISGEIQFHFENLWHTAEIIDVQLKRWKKLSEILLLSIQKPLLFLFPFGAKLEYRYEVNEGLYLKTQSSLGVLSRGHGIGNWEFTGLNTIVEPTETGIEKGLHFLKEHSFRVTNSIDLRKQKWQPKQGLYAHNMISVGKLSVMNESHTIGELKSLNEFVHLVAPNKGIKKKIKFKSKWNSRDSLEWSQMIRYGGLDDLRGYRENQFFGNWVVLPSIEFFNYVTGETTISIFSEGAIQKKYHPYPWNYGINLEQKYLNNHINISFAWGREDSFSQGKVHIKYVNIL